MSEDRLRSVAVGWIPAARALAAGLGLYHGYFAGLQIGGPLFGILMAANGAAFCALGVSALADHAMRWLRPQKH